MKINIIWQNFYPAKVDKKQLLSKIKIRKFGLFSIFFFPNLVSLIKENVHKRIFVISAYNANCRSNLPLKTMIFLHYLQYFCWKLDIRWSKMLMKFYNNANNFETRTYFNFNLIYLLFHSVVEKMVNQTAWLFSIYKIF